MRMKRLAVRILHTVMVVLTMVQSLGASGMAQGEANSGSRIDLADTVLSPLDLEAIGLAGFRYYAGQWLTWEDAVDFAAYMVDVDKQKIFDRFDSDSARFVAGYYNGMVITSEDGESWITVESSLVEFESEAAASTALTALGGAVNTRRRAELVTNTVGDESVTYVRSDEMDVLFRRGRVVGSVSLLTGFWPMQDFADALIARFDRLADRMIANIDLGLEGKGRRFGLQTIGFTDEIGDRVILEDRYYVRDGRYLPQLYEYPEVTNVQLLMVDWFSIESAYERYSYSLSDGGYYVLVKVAEHGGPQRAASLVNFTRDRMETLGGYEDIEPYEDLPDLGGREISFRYTWDYGFGPAEGMIIVVQQDNLSLTIEIESEAGVSPDLAIDMARTQLECLTLPECELIPLAIPGQNQIRIGRLSAA